MAVDRIDTSKASESGQKGRMIYDDIDQIIF